MGINKYVALAVNTSLLAIGISGCGITEPRNVENDYGASVHRIIAAQTYRPLVVANPDLEPVKSLDGEKASGILQAYREDVPKPAQIQNVINIAVGTQ